MKPSRSGHAADSGPGAAGRSLIRRSRHAALATLLDGQPYVSLAACACDPGAAPLLLLSDLAQHTRNLRATPALSLLFEGTAALPDRLAGARLTVLGRAMPCSDERARARFVARHPEAASYASFADFRLYRVMIERGHLVAGFGRISWIEAGDLRFAEDCSALAAAEADIVAQINADQADFPAAIAAQRLCRRDGGWRITGIDPEGFDLARGGEFARVDFAAPVLTPTAALAALRALAGGDAGPAGYR
jgi:putative heme iron utilization protein